MYGGILQGQILPSFFVSIAQSYDDNLSKNEYFLVCHRHDEDGNVSHISFSNQVRDSHLTTLEPEQVLPFYRALKLFNSLCYSQENYKKVKLQPGRCGLFKTLSL